MRTHLCSHEDERLKRVRRDQHNRVCDVYGDQHKHADLEHVNHSGSIVNLCLNYFGSDDDNVSRGIRVIVHSQFDSVDLPVDIQEDNDMFFVVVSQRPRLQRNSNYIISLGKDSPESNMFLYVHHLIL